MILCFARAFFQLIDPFHVHNYLPLWVSAIFWAVGNAALFACFVLTSRLLALFEPRPNLITRHFLLWMCWASLVVLLIVELTVGLLRRTDSSGVLDYFYWGYTVILVLICGVIFAFSGWIAYSKLKSSSFSALNTIMKKVYKLVAVSFTQGFVYFLALAIFNLMRAFCTMAPHAYFKFYMLSMALKSFVFDT